MVDLTLYSTEDLVRELGSRYPSIIFAAIRNGSDPPIIMMHGATIEVTILVAMIDSINKTNLASGFCKFPYLPPEETFE